MRVTNVLKQWIRNISKRFSRKGLYEFLEVRIAELEDRDDLAVLNIGSGGLVAERFKALRKARVLSLDIDESRRPDIVADARDMHMLEKDSFDAVFLMEVLEHVPDPAQAMGEIRRILKPGGRLVGSTPFILPIHEAPHDYYRYTRYGLLHLLRDFTDAKVRERNSFPEAALALVFRLPYTDAKFGYFFCGLAMCLLLPLYPFLWLAAKLMRGRAATTGYTFTAVK